MGLRLGLGLGLGLGFRAEPSQVRVRAGERVRHLQPAAALLEEVLQVLYLALEGLELREALLVLPLLVLEHLLEALLLLVRVRVRVRVSLRLSSSCASQVVRK